LGIASRTLAIVCTKHCWRPAPGNERVLADAGLAGYHGLAMGLALDRLAMLRKGIADIRLLCAADPRAAGQMLGLEPYRPVSAQPAARRDVSVACAGELDDELLGDRVREALVAKADWVEEIAVASRTRARAPTPCAGAPGHRDDPENLLVRVLLRHPTRSLANPEANALRDQI
jgi:phenylalanyl-tRNA synthetase alpha chain